MTPLIPRIESAKVGSISLAYLIRPGSDFRGDLIRCDTGIYTATVFVVCSAFPLDEKITKGQRYSAFPLDEKITKGQRYSAFPLDEKITKGQRYSAKVSGTVHFHWTKISRERSAVQCISTGRKYHERSAVQCIPTGRKDHERSAVQCISTGRQAHER